MHTEIQVAAYTNTERLVILNIWADAMCLLYETILYHQRGQFAKKNDLKEAFNNTNEPEICVQVKHTDRHITHDLTIVLALRNSTESAADSADS